MRQISLGLLLFLLFSGCSIFSSSDNKELDDARARWTRAGISDYNFVFTITCFCVETGTFDVEVQNNIVVHVTSLPDSEMVGNEVGKTIGDLFGILAEAYARNADQVTVSYDPALGFPTSIALDYIAEAIDDEVSYGVENFVRAE